MSHEEEELARLISGELDPESDEGREALEASGMNPGDFEGLLDLSARLDGAAQLRDEVMQEASEAEDAPGLDRVEASIERFASPPRRFPLGLWLAAAAGLLLLSWVAFFSDATPGEEQILGGGLRVWIEATEAGQYGPVHFEPEKIEGADEIVLLVFDREMGHDARARFEYPMDSSPWSDPEQSSWPDRIKLVLEGRAKDMPAGAGPSVSAFASRY